VSAYGSAAGARDRPSSGLTVGACSNSTTTVIVPQMGSCMVQGLSARCGTLRVPEDRLSGDRPHDPGQVRRVPRPQPQPGAGPGGRLLRRAGGSAVGDISAVLNRLGNLNQDRDLVFIDQRGTGGSNGLSCPSPPTTLADPAPVRRSIESCLAFSGRHGLVREAKVPVGRTSSPGDRALSLSAVAAWCRNRESARTFSRDPSCGRASTAWTGGGARGRQVLTGDER
jgi:hypothetical protein